MVHPVLRTAIPRPSQASWKSASVNLPLADLGLLCTVCSAVRQAGALATFLYSLHPHRLPRAGECTFLHRLPVQCTTTGACMIHPPHADPQLCGEVAHLLPPHADSQADHRAPPRWPNTTLCYNTMAAVWVHHRNNRCYTKSLLCADKLS